MHSLRARLVHQLPHLGGVPFQSAVCFPCLDFTLTSEEWHDWQVFERNDGVMHRAPKAILCLVSALDFHEVGTQVPAEVHIALPRHVRPPRIRYPRVRVVHMSRASLEAGVEERVTKGVHLSVFGIAKTVADCFKYRSTVGLDVAVEALQEVVRERRATPGEIMEYAGVDRVQNVIRPYLTALL